MKTRILLALSTILVLSAHTPAKERTEVSPRSLERIQKEVRHELLMLPHLGVFDHLAYRVNGPDVTLLGQVTQPTLKSDAEAVVKSIKGVERVDNQIEILPVSQFDNILRLRLYRSIYGFGQLQKYALGANQPILIVVKNGNVTLEGVVDSQSEKEIAGIRANAVSDVFSAKNNLRVAR